MKNRLIGQEATEGTECQTAPLFSLLPPVQNRLKLRFGALALLMLALPLVAGAKAVAQSTAPVDVENRLGAAAPTIAPLDQAYLTRFVRRHLERRLRGDEPYDPPYIPETLTGLNCPMAVSLRLHGRLLGAADSDPAPILEACRRAADLAHAAASKRQANPELPLEELLIELEKKFYAKLAFRPEVGFHNEQWRIQDAINKLLRL